MAPGHEAETIIVSDYCLSQLKHFHCVAKKMLLKVQMVAFMLQPKV